ncbi:MAG: hypothetical protein FJZ64_02690 [Chlamydiae bacterium]|nr:hypothetical protein [Chlamydiota bacterium]
MINFRSIGGNDVAQVGKNLLDLTKEIAFSNSPYYYGFFCLNPGEKRYFSSLSSQTLFFLENSTKAALALEKEMLFPGDSIQIENDSFWVEATQGPCFFLLAGTEKSSSPFPMKTITRKGTHYKVQKPWGHELWFNGQHLQYCLKEVMLKKGQRTSLQYHNYKEETNLLISGNANLIYKADPSSLNDDVQPHHLGSHPLSAITVIHISPGHLHRLEAVTDLFLYEASTPHLDDVIRVQDDKMRPNGRVVAEHSPI